LLSTAAIGREASPSSVSFDSVEKAVRFLQEAFGSQYPHSERVLARLAAARGCRDQAALRKIQREALLAHPALRGRSILFVVRQQYINEHGTEATMFQPGQVNANRFRGGGAIRVLDLGSGAVRTLVDVREGVARDPEVHFDGRKILFSMRRNAADSYHLFEVDAAGGDPVQLTFASGVSDIQPIYLPDDSVVFSSTRDPKYIPCQRHLMANLFRMNGDGSNIRQIGYNTQFEGRASLMPDGRLLYTRWEYVDKHFSSAYGLWTVNPDGTDHALYYGNYAWQPGAIVDARIVDGTHDFVAVFTAVHELGRGALVVADRSRGLEGEKPILHSWPADIAPMMRNWTTEARVSGAEYDSFQRVRVKYEDPFPLGENFILCSRQLAAGGRSGIFLVDVFGNELLIHDEAPGCFDPMPLSGRRRPPTRPSQVDLAQRTGTFYVRDVYVGDDMERVPRGTVTHLRVVEAPSKRAWVAHGMGDWAPYGSGDSHHPVALNWNHYNNKRILGTVPVEEDGSAYFSVPSGRFVYFQLLDRDGLMVHSMRSGTMLQPGERKGCTGCHEDRLDAAPVDTGQGLAMSRPPSPLIPWYGPERDFCYPAEVQPVLDEHCLPCHDYDGDGESLNLSGDKGLVFSHSYTNLMRLSPAEYRREEHERDEDLPLVSSVGAGPVRIIPPYSWGAYRSRLVRILRAGHYGVKLDRESMDRIVTWIDLNAPYYPSHRSYYAKNTAGRSPLGHQDLLALGLLVRKHSPHGAALGWERVNEYLCNQIGQVMSRSGPPVNFTRPERSACLQGLDGTACYRDALELIRKGQRQLQDHPRCDMPGFVPCDAHQEQLEFLARRQQIEARNRDAIVGKEKVYDGR